MDTNIASEIDKRLAEVTAQALKAFDFRLMQIYPIQRLPNHVPDHAVREAVRTAEESARGLVGECVSKILAISPDPQAMALIDQAVAGYLTNLERVIEGGRGIPLPSDAINVAAGRFDILRKEIDRSLNNAQSLFKGKKNKGGRKPIYDWDGVETFIKLQFLQGNIDGLTLQKNIALIMADWFSSQPDGKEPHMSQLNKKARSIMRSYL